MREIFVVVIVVMAASVASAQQGWKTKPYGEWNKQDIIKLGSDSPWAQVRHSDAPIGKYGSPTAYMHAATIQLRSALPIREALVRLKQLTAKYDKMNDKQRAELDANTRGILDCADCADNYIIALGPPCKRGSR